MPTASGGGAPGLGEDTGPRPVVRAATGLLLGVGVGLLAAVLSPRRPPAAGGPAGPPLPANPSLSGRVPPDPIPPAP